MLLQYRSTGEEVRLLQRALNEQMGKDLKADGQFGKLTEEVLRAFQRRNNLTVDGIYGPQTRRILGSFIDRKYIRYSDVDKAAVKFNLPADVIKGFKDVEAKSQGFLNDGRVIILFERHRFYRDIVAKFGQAKANEFYRLHPSVCNPNRGGYLGNEKEYPRLERAISMDRESALRSTSFGLFQIMGFNHVSTGHTSVNNFVNAMSKSEHEQLNAVLSFITKNPPLARAVRSKNYALIGRHYNGPAFETNDYANKLRNAVARYS
jgi:peptidoglycan hydrolase-like protein with peptidoglycan-binding domain